MSVALFCRHGGARAVGQIRNLVNVILAALILAGAAGDPAPRPDHDTRSDDWVTVKVQTALYRDLRFMGRRLSVDTVQGLVTLRGKVDSAADMQAAAEIARSVEGVKDVRSDLTVVPPAERAQVEAKDGKISRLIKEQLRQDPQLQSERIDARVDVGVVTLTGEVSSSAASARASDLARGVPGVLSVKNELVNLSLPELRGMSEPGRQRTAPTNGG
jgi:hyperosmotically inducible periplasmic protein